MRISGRFVLLLKIENTGLNFAYTLSINVITPKFPI